MKTNKNENKQNKDKNEINKDHLNRTWNLILDLTQGKNQVQAEFHILF